MADFYLRAAKVLDGHSNQKTSLKSLVKTNSKDESDAKRLLKLSISTLEYLNILKQLIKTTQIQSLENKAFGERDHSSSKGKGKGKEKEKEKDLQDPKVKSSPSTSPSPTSLLLVLLHDLLFSPKNQISSSSNWPPRIALERHKARLKAELIKIQLKNGASRLVDLKSGGQERKISERIPRWIRINEGKIGVEKCLEALSKGGWKLAEDDHLDQDGKKGVVVKNRQFHRTPHLPTLLCFHPSQTSQLLSHDLFKSGCIIMQDLASCFPAQVLIGDESEANSLSSNDRFVDATSAPGNKTSHLSALVRKRLGGKEAEEGVARVSAFEHSPQRYKTLCKLLSKSGCLCDDSEQRFQASINKGKGKGNEFHSKANQKRKRDLDPLDSDSKGSRNVKPVLSDFLTTDPSSEEWKDVSHMLLDPSCSGSGIVGRMDYLQEGSKDDGPSSENDNAEEILEGTSKGDSSNSENQLLSRLLKLGEFQLKMIKHAMKFPSLRRLTYSTCSIHAEENEHVVLKALESEEARSQVDSSNPTFKSKQKRFTSWRIAPRSEVIPTWSTRGIPKECNQDQVLADSLLRSIPGGDTEKYDLESLAEGEAHREACNGFFLALFVRDEVEVEGEKKVGEVNDDGHEDEDDDEDDEDQGEDKAVNKKRKLNRKKKEAKKKRKKAAKEVDAVESGGS